VQRPLAMKDHTILVVDDDPDILEIISLYLSNAGYHASTAANSAEALRKIRSIDFDLIILDIMLPGLSGTDLCRQIRTTRSCPILFISCVDEEEQILQALTVGGDDYIRKPFYPKELVARVTATLRRVELERRSIPAPSAELCVRDLVINMEKCAVYKNQREILLSPIEFDILLYMLEHPCQPLSCTEIYEQVWQSESLGDIRTVMVHVSNLRKKLEENDTKKYIKTVKKRGYVFLT
jgi:DNA-binding response OmpR family regulator